MLVFMQIELKSGYLQNLVSGIIGNFGRMAAWLCDLTPLPQQNSNKQARDFADPSGCAV